MKVQQNCSYNLSPKVVSVSQTDDGAFLASVVKTASSLSHRLLYVLC